MAEAAMATNPGMDRYNRYYETVLNQLQNSMGPERTDSQLKNYLTRMIRPSYDQAIAQRQQQTGQANAAIDTDAAGRGMGTSTWVTDAKNRQLNSQAADIANLNSNYNSTLYDALLNQIAQRDQLRMNLMGQAQSIAGNMYDRWKQEEDAMASSGSGGGGGGEGGGPGRRRGPGTEDDDDVSEEYGTGTGNPLFAALGGALKSAAEKTQAAVSQRTEDRQAQLAAQKAKQEADRLKQANANKTKLSGSTYSVQTPIYGASIKYDKYRKY